MEMKCPTCDNVIDAATVPVRGPQSGEWWLCLKCPTVICVNCYIQHITKHHPELYEPHKKPTSGHKKNKKSKK